MKNKTSKRLVTNIIIILLLSICLCITTLALFYSMVSVDDNLFVTGKVKIDLNDGKPVIEENEFLFEPGMNVKKDFYIHNKSSCSVYYKLYFENITGELADILEVKICDKDKVLFEGTPNELTHSKVAAADDVLRINEKKYLQIYFHFPEHIGNMAQNQFLTFDFAADAVQTRNNEDRKFE